MCARKRAAGCAAWTFCRIWTGRRCWKNCSGARNTQLSAAELFTGILHNRLGRVLTQAAGISAASPIAALDDGQLAEAARLAKQFDAELTEPLGMDSAQVTAGRHCHRRI